MSFSSSGRTSWNFGVTPARVRSPDTAREFFDDERVTTVPDSPARAVRPERCK